MDSEVRFLLLMTVTICAIIFGLCKWAEYVECKKPYTNICVETDSQLIMIYNPALKMSFPTTISRCVKTKKIKNECYRGETTEYN